ncbi:MAG: DASH family cryptochrome [bacterium]
MNALLWFRNDLRIHDHVALVSAAQAETLTPVYCFDPRQFTTVLGFERTGYFRANFLIESVAELRRKLQELGSNLVVRVGRPEDVLPKIAREIHATDLFFYDEAAVDERNIADAVARTAGLNVHRFWGASLLHVDDLGFDVTALPPVFTTFRKRVETSVNPRAVVLAPKKLPNFSGIDPGEIPTISTLGVSEISTDLRRQFEFKGGEDAGLERLDEYFWKSHAIANYKETRNELLGRNYASRFSAWLAVGALSPREIWRQLRAYESEVVANDSTYWMGFELLWRDFFQFVALKEGTHLFKGGGILRRSKSWKHDQRVFDAWSTGTTGEPFVDANMTELRCTGWMSNRGRQNVASWLTKTAGIDWRWGARWFESQLIDYDPCSNWGNWQYVAGVGHDPRDRVFNVRLQAERYDPDGSFVAHWS